MTRLIFMLKKDDFSRVPDALLKGFGKPQLAMVINLAQRDKLANADINKVKQGLSEQGYYLQIPPPIESLLKTHLEADKKD